MKYLTSTAIQEYSVDGFIIPKRKYTPTELNEGKTTVLALNDEEYEHLIANEYVKRGIDRGLFKISDTVNISLLSDTEKAKVLQEKLADQTKSLKELDALKMELKMKDKEIEALRNELAKRTVAKRSKKEKANDVLVEG